MQLSDLTYCQEHTLPRLHSMYRIQRTRRNASTVVIGAVRLPPTGGQNNRFDLPTIPVGYFAEEPETAAYEGLARREAQALSIADLRTRSLLWVQLTESVTLVDSATGGLHHLLRDVARGAQMEFVP
jgi:RES domain